MGRKEYSAGMVKFSFWFAEFRKVVQLRGSGKTWPEIKAMALAENLFAAPAQARALQIFSTVSTRVKCLPPSFHALFEQSDISTQKTIALVAVMQSDSLFFDFMYEVYREKLILGANELADSDFAIFFRDKQLQSEKVAKWQDYTLLRLGRCYRTLLMEAGMTDRASGTRKILKPILDKPLEDLLKAQGMDNVRRALTGVR